MTTNEPMSLEQLRAWHKAKSDTKFISAEEYRVHDAAIATLDAHLTSREAKGVALPNRMETGNCPTVRSHADACGWNACLDEVIRLNPAAQEATYPSIKIDPDTNECSPDPFVRKAFADGYETGYAHGREAAQPKSDVVQPVEAVDVTRSLKWCASVVQWATLERHIREGDFITIDDEKRTIGDILDEADHALAHPRPTGDAYDVARHNEWLEANAAPTVMPEPRDSDLHANAPDGHHEIARAVWEYMNRRSAPGVIMTMAYTAVLHALAKASPTGEQAVEVWESAHGYQEAFYKIAEILDIGAMPESPSKVFASVMLPMIRELVAAQPLPAGVPDGWKPANGEFSLAFKYGVRAHGRCVPFESNPYGTGDSTDAARWEAGWMAAKNDEVRPYEI